MDRYKIESVESGSSGEWYTRVIKTSDGDLVRYMDHEAENAQLKARLAESDRAYYDAAGTIDKLKEELAELRSCNEATMRDYADMLARGEYRRVYIYIARPDIRKGPTP